ncbi:hypothetical protein Scep_012382 [Stephania cephalantha]|uniref:Uncharacterized protein n=1 Tax=Stephania cephalantha TaxID=152367 RepID=A0AAP0JF07_9MAGN
MARCQLAVRATAVVIAGAAVNAPLRLAAAAARSLSPFRRSSRWPAAAPRAAVHAARLRASVPSICVPLWTLSVARLDSRLAGAAVRPRTSAPFAAATAPLPELLSAATSLSSSFSLYVCVYVVL